MPLWSILILGVGVTVVVVAFGVRLVRPTWEHHETRRDLGLALVTTSVFSLAVFVLGVLDESRLQKQETTRQRREDRANLQRAAQDERDGLRLQVALQHDLSAIDMRKKDLHDFFFHDKILTEAQFTGANLRGANFTGARLDGVDFRAADLYRAQFDNSTGDEVLFNGAQLRCTSLSHATLTDADFSFADLRGANVQGANLTGSSVQGIRFSGLEWDSTTIWQDGKTRRCSSDSCTARETGKPPYKCPPPQ